MDISMNTPALLFPAISLIMLAFTNRFLALANVVRTLHGKHKNPDGTVNISIHAQIKNLRLRLRLIKNMQILGVTSFVMSIATMYLIYIQQMVAARWIFAFALVLFMLSLIISLIEIIKSTESLEIELSDIQD